MSAATEAAGGAYLARVLDGIYEASGPPLKPLPARAFEIDIELDRFTATVVFTMDGESHAATETSPAEYPQPTILRCSIGCGAWLTEANFDSLSEAVREQILDECRAEASWR